MKEGILLVAFGAGNAQSAASLRAVQTVAEQRFGLPVRWAFTSDVLRARLARARTKSDSVLKALRRMRFERYTHVAVQSLHVIPGIEYADVIRIARLAQEEGLYVSPGQPLIMSEEDAPELARLLIRHLPPQRRKGENVVCMAHGSPHETNFLYEAWGRAVRELDPDVYVAGITGSVRLDDILPRLRQSASARVWLLPLMSVVGRHTLQDMAGENGTRPSWKERIEAAGLPCVPDLRGLAEGPDFVSLWMERLAQALTVMRDTSAIRKGMSHS